MADLNMALAEAVKLNRSISQFLKFSTYTDYDDLSGLDIDFTDGEQLLLWEELRCQRRYEIVRKRRRNFVVFRRGGGNKTKRFLAQKECSRFAVSGA